MRELPDQRTDKRLNADITRTLKFGTLVTPAQQQTARERLMQSAAQQIVLAPLEVVEPQATLRDHALTLRQRTISLINLLILDSSAYERAHSPVRRAQAEGRHAFAMIRMSA